MEERIRELRCDELGMEKDGMIGKLGKGMGEEKGDGKKRKEGKGKGKKFRYEK